MKTLKIAFAVLMLIMAFTACSSDKTNKKMENTEFTNQWDKTFPQSDKVNHKKVKFTNRYGITLAGDLYTPKNPEGK